MHPECTEDSKWVTVDAIDGYRTVTAMLRAIHTIRRVIFKNSEIRAWEDVSSLNSEWSLLTKKDYQSFCFTEFFAP